MEISYNDDAIFFRKLLFSKYYIIEKRKKVFVKLEGKYGSMKLASGNEIGYFQPLFLATNFYEKFL